MAEGQPTLTDGVVTLRPWRDDDVDQGAGDVLRFTVEVDDRAVGEVSVRTKADRIGELGWSLQAEDRGRGYAVRAVRVLVDWGFAELALARLEAYVDNTNEAAKRVATRSGLHREGILRGHGVREDERHDMVLYARLRSDPPVTAPDGFRSLLNSSLPRKRAIGQMLVRDPDGRVLLCRLTYKQDWDLPGGVVEVGESPRLAVSREVDEELALDIEAGALLLTDWLPPWGGWDDAVCLVFDGGVHDPSVLDAVVKQAREIRDVEFCTVEQVRERAADFTARRVEAALASLRGDGPPYTESGR